jgi:hypothetical protein
MKGSIYGVVLGISLSYCAPPAAAQQLRLSWVDTSANETGFVIERRTLGRPAGRTPWQYLGEVGVNITSYVDSSVLEGQRYCYRVAAFNASGFSQYTRPRCRRAKR